MDNKQIINQFTKEKEVIADLTAQAKALDEKLKQLKAQHAITEAKVVAECIESGEYVVLDETKKFKVEIEKKTSFKLNTEQLSPAEAKMLKMAVLEQIILEKRAELQIEDIPGTKLEKLGITAKFTPELFKGEEKIKAMVRENKL